MRDRNEFVPRSSGERKGGEGHVSLQLHETIDPAHVVVRPESVPQPLPRLRIRTSRRLVLAGRLGLIFLPTLVFSLREFSTATLSLVAAGTITVAWFGATRVVLAACRPAQAALGQAGSTALASLGGVVSVSALALWVPWLSIRPLTVVQVAAAVFVLQLAWERLVRASAAERRRVLVIGAHGGGGGLVGGVWLGGGRRYELVGFVDDDAADAIAGIPVLGGLAELPLIVAEQQPDLVVLAISRNRLEAFTSLLDAAGPEFDVVGLAEFHEQAFGRVP